MSSIRDRMIELGRRKYIRITRPNSNDVWQVGQEYDIRWKKSSGLHRRVHIGLLQSNRRLREIIRENAPNTGRFPWTIPNVRAGKYIIGIITADREVYDLSDIFEISAQPIIAKALEIGAGDNSSFAVRKSDRSVWSWGDMGAGYCGDGSQYVGGSSTPIQAYGLGNAIQIEADSRYVIGLHENGNVYTWGFNQVGNHGLGGPCPEQVPPWAGIAAPTQIPGLSGITKISAGRWALALKDDGTVWAWGSCLDPGYPGGTTPVQVPNLQNIVDIAAGGYHCVALDNNGDVWAWGLSWLGDGTTNPSPVPKKVFSGTVSITAGTRHTLALKVDKTLWAWGHNQNGMLGIGSRSACSSPVKTDMPEYPEIRKIAAKRFISFAINEQDELWAWGNNADGQFGIGSSNLDNIHPLLIHTGIKDIAPGWRHTVFLKNDETVWAAGWNLHGQIGDGTNTNRLHAVQVHLYD